MAEVEDREEGHHISPPPTTAAQMSGFPRDLLKRFMAATNNHLHKQKMNLPGMKVEAEQRDAGEKEGAEEEELELSLGLSMNGRFGVDPNAAKKIKRTTSKPEFVNQARNEEMGYAVAPVAAYGGGGSSGSGYGGGGGGGGGGHLIRTCSLPTETEEEWRKRKELQTLRRMEARRKRSEKQQRNSRRNHRGLSEEVAAGSDGGSNNLVEQGAGAGGLSRTVSLTARVGGLGLNDKEKGNVLLLPPSPPSIGSSSHGTGSSGTSESESQHGQGPTPMDTTSPTGDNMLQNGELKSPATSGARVAENSGKIAAVTMRTQANGHPPLQNRNKDTVKSMLEDMPSVSTKGVGPNGKKIEGFLYRYSKGEEVKILCVCHGLFMTPAEFVKHAGGEDVANPLKHIVVSPSFL